ncbi:MAG: hypothetical protein QOF25_501 [Mycobacterium sp.]|jgi:hypothetical protein|nr:hypothetical protein [Mycobacterium sp.]
MQDSRRSGCSPLRSTLGEELADAWLAHAADVVAIHQTDPSAHTRATA